MSFDRIREIMNQPMPVDCDLCGEPMLGRVVGVGKRGPARKLYHPECYRSLMEKEKKA